MKVGGVNAYIVYPGWYPCHVGVVNGALFFQKTAEAPSARRAFSIRRTAPGFISAPPATTGEPWHRYSGRAASVGAPATPDDQIGLLTGIGNNRLRIEIPGPVEESYYDIIELA